MKLKKKIKKRIIDPFRKIFTTGTFAGVVRMIAFIITNPALLYFIIGMGTILLIMLTYHMIDTYFIRNDIWETIPVA